jgi:hypothetical protein
MVLDGHRRRLEQRPARHAERSERRFERALVIFQACAADVAACRGFGSGDLRDALTS